MKQTLIGASVLAGAILQASAAITFESVPLGAEGYWNGSDGSGAQTIDGVTFANDYTSDWDSWDGFSFSNQTDTTTSGFLNQYSAITGGGAFGSSNYAVFFQPFGDGPHISMSSLTDLTGLGMMITNTTYTALALENGEGGAKKFADGDWLLLTIDGYASGSLTGSVDFYLADYRFGDESLNYIVNDWRLVDLTALGSVDELKFSMSSSDNGEWGMNTPSYFAMDDFLTAVPEPSALLLSLVGLNLLIRRKR